MYTTYFGFGSRTESPTGLVVRKRDEGVLFERLFCLTKVGVVGLVEKR